MKAVKCLFAAAVLLAAQVSMLMAADAPGSDVLSPAANRAFLDDNAHKPGVTVLPSGLEFRVLKNGFGGHPSPADNVEFSYSARLINDRLVDSASSDLPANLQVSNLMRGLNEALLRMQVGDRWQLVIPAELALGAKGNGAVPPNQTLVVDISLMAVIPPQQAQSQDSSPFSLYGYNRGTEHQAGAIFTIRQ
jgi:FKBP-type peptidyl-prolyl cis-trans isomerase FklB